MLWLIVSDIFGRIFDYLTVVQGKGDVNFLDVATEALAGLRLVGLCQNTIIAKHTQPNVKYLAAIRMKHGSHAQMQK